MTDDDQEIRSVKFYASWNCVVFYRFQGPTGLLIRDRIRQISKAFDPKMALTTGRQASINASERAVAAASAQISALA